MSAVIGFRAGNMDSSAVILKDGEVIAGIEEERLSRVKHAPSSIPKRAINFLVQGSLMGTIY